MISQNIEFNIPANLQFAAFIRNISNDVFELAGFNPGWCNRLKLVVDELFMNAVRYGSTENTSKVHIRFVYDDKKIEFIIADDGTGSKSVDVENLKKIIQKNINNTDFTRTSGRGLAMIAHLWTDELKVNKSTYGGTEVSFVKKVEISTTPKLAVESPTPIQKEKELTKAKVKSKSAKKGPSFTITLKEGIDQYNNINENLAPVYAQINNLPKGAVLTLDFKNIEYINSMFIANLASWYNVMNKKQGFLRLKNTNSQIKEVLELVGLEKIIPIE